jgi:outer membrane protein TolC
MQKIFLLALLFVFSNVVAQKNLTDHELELIGLGLQKSYTLKNASYELSIDTLENKAIKQNFIPTLSMDGAYAYGVADLNVDVPVFQLPIAGIDLFEGDTDFKAKGQIFNSSLTAKMLLFSGMQVTYGSKATQEKIKAKNYMLDKERADIIIDIVDTFDKIELLHKSEVIIEESEKRLAKEKEKVKRAIENGLATPYDREKITAAELKLASKKAELYGNIDLLYLKLRMLTGKEVPELKTYDFDLKPWVLEENNSSYLNRPELSALEATIQAYDYKIKMSRAAFLPKVQAFASLSYFNLFDASLDTPYNLPISEQPINLDLNHLRSFPTYMVGVGFHWDIFNGLKHSNETQRSSIEKNIAENKKTDAEEKLELYAKKIRIDFDVKNKQIALKEKEMTVAKNTLHLAIKSYREGLITISERLEAEINYQMAVLEYYKMISMQRRAALELLLSTGSLNLNNLSN